MTDSDQVDTARGPDELQAELDRLKEQNATLQEQLSGTERPGGRGWRRRWLSITCAVLAGILLPLAVITVWARDTVLNTDDYVATIAPLADDEDVQEAATFRVTEVIAEEADFESLAEDALSELGGDALPEGGQLLAGPIASGVEGIVSDVVGGVVASDQFANLWEEVNRTAHENLVDLVTGRDSDLVGTSEGRVVLKLGSLAEEAIVNLDERLGTDLADTIPAEDLDAELVLVESDELANVQDQVRWFDRLSWFTLLLALAFLVGTVLFAEDRRLGVRRVGFATVVPMLLALLAYAWARDAYTTGLPEGVHNPAAAAAVFDILTRFVLSTFRSLLVLGLILLFGAWVVGPSPHAARVRAWWDALLGRASESGADREVGPIPIAVAAHERTLLMGAAALGFLALVLWTHPTGMVVLLIVIVTLLVMGGIRLVAEVARRAEASAADDDDPDQEAVDASDEPGGDAGASDAAGSGGSEEAQPVSTSASAAAQKADGG